MIFFFFANQPQRTWLFVGFQILKKSQLLIYNNYGFYFLVLSIKYQKIKHVFPPNLKIFFTHLLVLQFSLLIKYYVWSLCSNLFLLRLILWRCSVNKGVFLILNEGKARTWKRRLQLPWNSMLSPMLLVLLELENSLSSAVRMEHASVCCGSTVKGSCCAATYWPPASVHCVWRCECFYHIGVPAADELSHLQEDTFAAHGFIQSATLDDDGHGQQHLLAHVLLQAKMTKQSQFFPLHFHFYLFSAFIFPS